MSESFEWYCENCGYLPGSRVTFHETCDLCHVPVVLHNREVRDAEIERLTRDRDIAERKAAVCREDAEINARRAESAEALVAELEAAIRSIATCDQDDRPLPGEDAQFDWRRRSEKQERIARALLSPQPAPLPDLTFDADDPLPDMTPTPCGTCGGSGNVDLSCKLAPLPPMGAAYIPKSDVWRWGCPDCRGEEKK